MVGAVDILVNNAGGSLHTPQHFLDESDAHWDAVMGLNLTAAVRMCRLALPGMIERRYGRIVNMASLAALVPAPAGHTLYAACKALIVKFSEALGNEVRPFGVHVTALCPGFTRSEFHDVTGTRALVQKMPRWLWIDADTVAREGFDAVMAGMSIQVPGRINRLIVLLSRLLPQRLLVAMGRPRLSEERLGSLGGRPKPHWSLRPRSIEQRETVLPVPTDPRSARLQVRHHLSIR